MKKLILAVSAILVCGTCAIAGATSTIKLTGSSVYSDPVFQDYVETADGYLNPARRPAAKYRDSVISSTSSKKGYVFVSILPKAKDYSSLVRQLGSSAGFRLTGERISLEGRLKRVRIVGWVRADSLEQLSENPGVIIYSVLPGAAL